MKRRDFLKGALILPVAPAIVKADNIMKIYIPKKNIKEYIETEGGFLVPPEIAEQIWDSIHRYEKSIGIPWDHLK